MSEGNFTFYVENAEQFLKKKEVCEIKRRVVLEKILNFLSDTN
jgi:hypothetical protein